MELIHAKMNWALVGALHMGLHDGLIDLFAMHD